MKTKYPGIELMQWVREFKKGQLNMNEMIYWTSRKTNFDKEIWYEKSPGCCDSVWFPYATQFLQKFPWLAVRCFWLMVKIHEALNVFITNYPPVYPNLLT